MTNWLNHHGSCQSIMDVVNDHVIPHAGLGAIKMKNKSISHKVCGYSNFIIGKGYSRLCFCVCIGAVSLEEGKGEFLSHDKILFCMTTLPLFLFHHSFYMTTCRKCVYVLDCLCSNIYIHVCVKFFSDVLKY